MPNAGIWCARWFIPLLFLPLPSASPYFLTVFIFSLIVQARPCFYCILMLTALFTSSCHWPSVPIDAPLSAPWGNATTFSQVLDILAPALPAEHRPSIIPIREHCWCDIAMHNFQPLDIPNWEAASVLHWKEAFEASQTSSPTDVQTEVDPSSEETVPPEVQTQGLFTRYFSWGRRSAVIEEEKSEEASSRDGAKPQELTEAPRAQDPNPTPKSSPPTPSSSTPQWELDLREHGIPVVLDFGWKRRSS
ncbi:hypothetical protein OF83DRAFT_1171492 [Amylostereum chailletii]|nr:hypothetical protein OF83DRAFT_1171492 [Amylostereum chailletii]